jgi:hypothetical protein
MKHTHLTDDQLIEMCMVRTDAPAALDCPVCDERRAAVAVLLDEVSAAADDAFATAFPPDRVARQYTRILQRLEQQGRLGRVIAFPLSQARSASTLRPRPVRRWVAGAAAAGLVIGMAAGHLAHELPAFRRSVEPAQQAAYNRPTPPADRAVASTTIADDEFLLEIERAVGSSGPAALRRLDAVTPVAWEVP